MSTDQLAYKSYLLRLWQSGSASLPVWRASLEDPHTGERLGFPDLEQLFAYLAAQTGRASGSQQAQPAQEPEA